MTQADDSGAARPDPVTEAVIDARLAALTARFGDRLRLTEEQWAKVRERIGRSVEHGAALRRAPLTNDDEPEIVFVPYRGGGQ